VGTNIVTARGKRRPLPRPSPDVSSAVIEDAVFRRRAADGHWKGTDVPAHLSDVAVAVILNPRANAGCCATSTVAVRPETREHRSLERYRALGTCCCRAADPLVAVLVGRLIAVDGMLVAVPIEHSEAPSKVALGDSTSP
jgi:hypothetical protein